ncbi:MAG: FprA family A-type flavoprotein [Clostridiales bacterium]|nr:FprA family A-type flavoprotein [Clostridiales bacterium]
MYCVREVTNDLYWVGANDHRLTLFENIHPIPRGVSYNAYLLLDEHTVLFDTVDWSACRQLLENLDHLLAGRPLDYLVINHMEPDHGASIEEILLRYPDVKVISTEKSFMLMRQFHFQVDTHELITVKEGDTYTFGSHTVTFVGAPMVHWPEAMVTFDVTNGVLFSADAFGSFIALDGKLFADEVNFDRDWIDEARRYLTNIVGKYGPHIQLLLKKAGGILDQIKYICPLHGPVWRKDLMYFIEKYDKWSRYEPEEKGIMIVYASMYGNTEAAAQALAARLCEKGCPNVAVYDVSNTHVSYLVSEAFKYSHIVLTSVTYNLGIYPVMHNFLMDLKALNLQNRTFAIIENGSWACKSGDLMQKFVDEELKNMTVLNERVSMASALGADKAAELDALADALVESVAE